MALTTIQAVYDEARRALESGKDERAIGLSEHLLESFPYFLEAYRILGEAQLNRQDIDAAVAAFERVLRSDPENIPVHVGLGVAYERQGRLDAAIKEFEQAFEIKPDLPELRNQLMRLYTEAWGNETGLRLKQAGLARLYVRGQKFEKAIQEFRDILEKTPDRLDMKVALAEAYWRNGQEQEAAELCREILADDPNVLKANLILGYSLLAAGNPKGKELWSHAQQLDPSQGVAHTLFDGMLPPVEPMPSQLPEFDEAVWREAKAAREREAVEREARERAEAEERARAAERREQEQEEELVLQPAGADSWLAEIEEYPAPQRSGTVSNDDFLLSLLLGGATASAAPAPAPKAPEPEPEPEPISAVTEISEPEATEADFNLDDLGLTPFSLDDFGSDTPTFQDVDTIPGFDEPEAAPAPTASAEADDFDLPDSIKPFSFDDWGSESESFESLPGMSQTGGGELPSQLQPFALENFEDVQTRPSEPTGDEVPTLPSAIKPFSLDELSPDSLDSGSGGGIGGGDLPFSRDFPLPEADAEPRGFSWQEPKSRERASFIPAPAPDVSDDQPTIFQRLIEKKQTEALPPLPADRADVELDEEVMGFFSHDDVDLRLDSDEPDPASLEVAPITTAPATDAAPMSDEPEMTPFSLADLGLSDDEIAALQGAETASSAAAMSDEPEMTPFSLADLGLSDDEIASLDANNDGTVTEADFAGITPATSDEPEMTPFSLADLGLSDDEIAALQGAETASSDAPTSDEPEMTPFSLADLGLSDDEIAALQGAETATDAAPASGEQEMTPFSLADLGLSDDEIASLQSDLSPGSDPAPTDFDFDSGGLQPFSLEDLGFEGEAGNVEFGGELLQPVSFDDLSGVQEDDSTQIQPSIDAIYESLFALGQQQGFIDLTDIINRFDDPESQAEDIDRIALELYSNGIAIHDGDEVIDMEEIASEFESEYGEEVLEPVATSDEPEMTPFSLADLGLSDDEIAALQGAETASSDEPTSDEPEMTPFSLADLGLTDDEIASLDANNDGSVTEADFAGSTPATSDEPEMTPFSLADLGLSDDEIAALQGAETASSDAPTSDEPEMTPFSLADLGLSDDEIAALQGAETASSDAPTSDEPEMTPFSLADLGLTDDEIASLDANNDGTITEADFAGSTPATSDELEMTPFSLADLGLTDDEIATLQGAETTTSDAPASDEPEMTPFSLADLGLTDDEIAALQGAETTTSDAHTSDEPEMTPFSLADLGLTDDEIASLDANNDGVITETDFTGTTPATSDEPEMTPFSLADLGLTDDEIASLDANNDGTVTEADFAGSTPATSDEPEMTPFSLADLGLTDDEIASLDANNDGTITEADFAGSTPATSDEPEMTPFSLADLGLTDDEIASLNDDTSEETDFSALDPDLAPLSLEDLGLSEDDISVAGADDDERNLKLSEEELESLDLGIPGAEPLIEPGPMWEEAQQAVDEVTSDQSSVDTEDVEPEMTPFSLADLGLTDAEIASLDIKQESDVYSDPEQPLRDEAPLRGADPVIRDEAPLRSTEPVHTDESSHRDSPAIEDTEAPLRDERPLRDDRYTIEIPSEPQEAKPEPVRAAAPESSGDGPDLSAYREQLVNDPDNHGLRLAIARMLGQVAQINDAVAEYKRLIKNGQLLDETVEDLRDLIESQDDPAMLQRLHRTLGDAYSKQSRWREAMDEYSWVLK